VSIKQREREVDDFFVVSTPSAFTFTNYECQIWRVHTVSSSFSHFIKASFGMGHWYVTYCIVVNKIAAGHFCL